MKVLPYRIRLRQPVLASTLGGDPNNVVGLDYLPGSALRALLIKAFSKGQTLDAADPRVRRLFFDHRVRFLNAYPAGFEGRRAIPTPRSWHRIKGDEGSPALDFALNQPASKEGTTYEAVSAPFVNPYEEEGDEKQRAYVIVPEREQSIHTTRDRRAGRARESGDIYGYDALAPAQTFRAAILCDEDADAEILHGLFPPHARIGGGRTAYGEVEITPEPPTRGDDWRELEGVGDEPAIDDDELVVTLLSDTLLRDEHGTLRPDTELLRTVLERRLGNGVALRPRDSFLAAETVGGFNNTWGLPLPQSAAIAMGSVFVYQLARGAATSQQLLALEWTGIGERRAEGFGRLLVNWPTHKSWRIGDWSGPGQRSTAAITSNAGQDMAKAMARRMLASRVERAMTKTAMDHSTDHYRIHRAPPPSQLARLRQTVQEELLEASPSPGCITAFLNDLQRTAMNHLSRARIEGQPLDGWLRGLANGWDETTWQGRLGLRSRDLPKVGEIAPSIDQAQRDLDLLRFLDLVLARAIKDARKGGGT